MEEGFTHVRVISAQQECTCRACGADWHGDPIPQDMIDNGMYDALCKCGAPNHLKRSKLMYDLDLKRVVSVICPDCEKEFQL